MERLKRAAYIVALEVSFISIAVAIKPLLAAKISKPSEGKKFPLKYALHIKFLERRPQLSPRQPFASDLALLTVLKEKVNLCESLGRSLWDVTRPFASLSSDESD